MDQAYIWLLALLALVSANVLIYRALIALGGG